MNKRKIFLGLLVFVFGVMMTACGDKNNTSNTTNTKNELPKSFEDNVCEDCIKTYSGTLRIADENLYLQAFGYTSGTDINITGGNTIFDQIINSIAGSVGGVVVCAGKIYFSQLIADALDIEEFEGQCTQQDLDMFNPGGGFDEDEVASSYSARIRVRYVDSRAEAVEMTVNDNLGPNGEDSQEIFALDRTNIFINNEGTLLLKNASGRLRFGTTGGQVIGEFRE